MIELGGFEETPAAIDGDERDWEAFNFCLAEEYLWAMESENWQALGNMDSFLIGNIVYWLNYDGEIAKNIEDKIANISKGLIKTYQDRTFVEAIIDCHKGNLAETFICEGNHDVRLYLTAIFYGKNTIENLLNNVKYDFNRHTPDNFANFFNEIFLGIEQKYNTIFDDEKKIELLKRIKPFIKEIRFPQEYKEVMLDEKEKMTRHQWYKKMQYNHS